MERLRIKEAQQHYKKVNNEKITYKMLAKELFPNIQESTGVQRLSRWNNGYSQASIRLCHLHKLTNILGVDYNFLFTE